MVMEMVEVVEETAIEVGEGVGVEGEGEEELWQWQILSPRI